MCNNNSSYKLEKAETVYQDAVPLWSLPAILWLYCVAKLNTVRFATNSNHDNKLFISYFLFKLCPMSVSLGLLNTTDPSSEHQISKNFH